MSIRLSFIGCGSIAGRHLNAYKELADKGLKNFDIVAMCDVYEDSAKNLSGRAQQYFGGGAPKIYTELSEMLENENLDAVDICTPHWNHHICAMPCFKVGVDVIIEKPLAVTVKAGKKIIEEAEKNGRIVAIAEQVRRGICERAMHWVINTKEMIGQPRMFFSEVTDFSLGIETPWRLKKTTGGGWLVIDGGVHYVDLLRYFFGDVERVYAQTRTYEKNRFQDINNLTGEVEVTTEDTSTAILTFNSGLVGVWTLTRSLPGKNFSNTIYYGCEGSLDRYGVNIKDGSTINMKELQEQYMNNLTPEEKEKLFPGGITNRVTLGVYDFLMAIERRSKPEIDGWEGLKALAICDAIYESSWYGQAVFVQDVMDGKVEGYQKEINEHWGL